jgi:DNA processing protein
MIDENLAIWALAAIEGIGSARIKLLIERCGSASAVFEHSLKSLAEIETIGEKLAEIILKPRDWASMEKRQRDSIPEGSEFIPITDPSYPGRLRNIPDPPPYFYFSGDPGIFENPCFALVGSRKPSDYGLRVAGDIAGRLAAAGVTVISGLAHGIDSTAHEAALKSGGKTAAVFGNGLDIIYPPGNRKLSDRIREKGCLISEFPRGTKPERFNFPIRNRIISGLSDGVLVVEARAQSGALITANLALEQGRDVMAVPGNIDSELSEGPNNLLRSGAIPVLTATDIFDNFGWHTPIIQERREKPDLSGDEEKIYEHLSVKPVHLDDLIRKTGLGHGRAAEVLLNLELKGFIMRKPGNYLVQAR